MQTWQIEEKKLELKYSWKISRNTSEYKINFFITIADGSTSGTGEVAPNIRYGETPDLIKEQFDIFHRSAREFNSLSELNAILETIQLPHALRFGIESAFIHYLCKKQKKSIYNYLKISPPALPLQTTFSLPIMPPGELRAFYDMHNLGRFSTLKIKVNREEGFNLINELNRISAKPLMIDGNECWQDVEELIYFMEKLKKFPVVLMEQPMPDGLDDEYYYLKKHSPFELIADESCTLAPDFDKLQKQFHGVNIKLMKAGGYLNALRLLDEARKMKMKTMVGCMVESSLGIASAMNICAGVEHMDLDGFLILKNEPWGLVEEKNGSLMFAV